MDQLVYHIMAPSYRYGYFIIRGFPLKIDPWCMGLADRIEVEQDEDDISIKLPRYLCNMPGCFGLYQLKEIDGEMSNGDTSEDNPNTRSLARLKEKLIPWRLLPFKFSKLIIALHMKEMVKEELFYCDILETDTVSVNERLRWSDPDDPTEQDGGYRCGILYLLTADYGIIS
jgi:hypothetical protein